MNANVNNCPALAAKLAKAELVYGDMDDAEVIEYAEAVAHQLRNPRRNVRSTLILTEAARRGFNIN
jgi:hypothetical protein